MLASPAFAETVTVEHASGSTDVETGPKTVVVFDLSALDTLDALGVTVTGVPDAPMPASLSQFSDDGYETVGSLFEPDFEAVNALQPDLIIVGGRSQAKYDDLSRIAPTIDLTIPNDAFLEGVEGNARLLGRIFDRQDAAEAEIAALETSLETLQNLTDDAGTALVLLTTGGKISAFGPGSRFGDIYDIYGFAPADADLDVANHGQAVSFEYIMEQNPDWLYVLDRDAAIGRSGEAAEQLLDNELVARTNAWQNDQVIYADGGLLYLASGGIRAQKALADQVIGALQD
nr:siderophore ABC transporter substrate-binding protein [Martelella radicis]